MAKTLTIPWPNRGVHQTTALGEQPKGTTSDALNVMPRTSDGRRRIGPRPGCVEVKDISANNQIQWIGQTTYVPAPITAADSAAGAGANTVDITVNDGTTALSGAKVRLTAGAVVLVDTTDGSGVAAFTNVAAGDYSVEISYPGYAFPSVVLTVDGNETATYSMTASPGGRVTQIVIIQGGKVYTASTPGGTYTRVGSGAADFATTGRIHAVAARGGLLFAVDGVNTKKIDLLTRTVATHSASEGTAPTSCTLVTLWRDRLVYAGPDQNWFMSRSGDYDDFDYAGAGGADTSRAVAGNNANSQVSGFIGRPITALLSWSEDVLLVGHDDALTRIAGDPAEGGAILPVSFAQGCIGADAMVVDANRGAWILGSQGLARYDGGSLTPMDDPIPGMPDVVTRGTTRVQLVWDAQLDGLLVLMVPSAFSSSTIHYWYDQETQGWWPWAFSSSNEPLVAGVFDGDAPGDRVLLLGSRDNKLYKLDDGTFESGRTYRLGLGPVQMAQPGGRAKALWAQGLVGLNQTAIPAAFRVGDSPAEAQGSTPQQSLAISLAGASAADARTARQAVRLSGQYAYVELSPTAVFAFESLLVAVEPAGRGR